MRTFNNIMNKSWSDVKLNKKKVIVYSLLVLLGAVISMVLYSLSMLFYMAGFRFFQLVDILKYIFIYIPLFMGCKRVILNLVRNDNPLLRDSLWVYEGRHFRFFLLCLLESVYCLIIILPITMLLCYIVPESSWGVVLVPAYILAMIMPACVLPFTWYIFLDNPKIGLNQAFVLNFKMMRGYWGRMLALCLVLIFIIFVPSAILAILLVAGSVVSYVVFNCLIWVVTCFAFIVREIILANFYDSARHDYEAKQLAE